MFSRGIPGRRFLPSAWGQIETSEASLNAHLLRGLISPEKQGPSCTFHDSIGIETTEHTRFVILSGV